MKIPARPWKVIFKNGYMGTYKIDGVDSVEEDVIVRDLISMAPELFDLCEAVVLWAKTPGNHRGNPYGHDFVLEANRILDLMKGE